MGLLHVLLDLLYPPKCPFCGQVLERGEEGWCAPCREDLPWTQPGDGKTVEGCDACLSPLWYRDGPRDGMHRYKFQGGQGHARLFGDLMAQCLRDRWAGGADLVTWAPLHPRRKRERGYDQAELLARSACRRWDTRPERLLEKTRDNPAQSGLTDREARRENVKGAYRAAGDCRGRRVLLVDDICTTGATLGQCAAVLLDAGAEAVVCAAAARTPPGRPDASDEELF